MMNVIDRIQLVAAIVDLHSAHGLILAQQFGFRLLGWTFSKQVKLVL
jgi:hypothetical protein